MKNCVTHHRACDCIEEQRVAELATKDAEIAQLTEDFQHAKAAGMVEAYRAVVSGFARNLPEASAAKWPELAEATAAAWDWREAKDAEIARLREQRDHEAWLNAACLTIAETGERWGDEVQPNLAMRKVLQVRERNVELLEEVHRQDGEIDALNAELAALREAVRQHEPMCLAKRAEVWHYAFDALREAVMGLPWYERWTYDREQVAVNNAVLAAARKIAGLGE